MIPVNEPWLWELELEYVTECVRSGWISSTGKFIDQFEQDWAGYCGRRHGIAVSNGTVALQLAVSCLDLQPGDQIIIPSFTIISCALAVLYNRCTPVLVDADPVTWCMNVNEIEKRITPRTRAIMPVHIYGHPVDMDRILQLASKHGIAVIEDAAEAHGAEYLAGRDTSEPHWKRCGSFGELSCFSFYANKLITTGEGGMILTDNETLAEKARSRRNLCFQPGRRFYHEQLGFNFRITNLQAALAIAQMQRMEEILQRKRRMAEQYTQNLKEIPWLQLPPQQEWARSVYWMYGVVLSDDAGMDAVKFADKLKAVGIETRPFFLGMHEQPALHRLGLFQNSKYSVTERLSKKGLYLPSGLALTSEQLSEVCEKVRAILL